MRRAAWLDRYLLGLDEIDTQHKALFDELGSLCASAESDDSDRKMEASIERFTLHMRAHCAAEEAVMKAARYPEESRAQHLQEHAQLLSHLDDAMHQMRQERSRAEALLLDVGERLAHHIDTWDRHYADTLLTHASHRS